MTLSFQHFIYTFQAMDISMGKLAISDTVRGTLTFDLIDFKNKTKEDLDVSNMNSALIRRGKDKESRMKSRFVNLGIEVFESSFIKGV